jgi:hypothetical protein
MDRPRSGERATNVAHHPPICARWERLSNQRCEALWCPGSSKGEALLGREARVLPRRGRATQLAPLRSMDTNGFVAGDCQHVGVLIRLEPGQPRLIATIHSISHDPRDGNMSMGMRSIICVC